MQTNNERSNILAIIPHQQWLSPQEFIAHQAEKYLKSSLGIFPAEMIWNILTQLTKELEPFEASKNLASFKATSRRMYAIAIDFHAYDLNSRRPSFKMMSESFLRHVPRIINNTIALVNTLRSKLYYLNLRSVNVTDDQLQKVVVACPELLYLEMSASSITDTGMESLSQLFKLHTLKLHYCHGVTALALKKISLFTNLISLSLSCNNHLNNHLLLWIVRRSRPLKYLNVQHCNRLTNISSELIDLRPPLAFLSINGNENEISRLA